MTLADLRRTLSEAMTTGKIGTPIALRIHLQLSDSQTDLIEMLSAVIQTAKPVFAAEPATLTARRDPDERQLNILLAYPGGQTLLATVGRGSVANANLHLLLIGNHGVIRLEGAEVFEPVDVKKLPNVDGLRTSIDRSLQSAEAVVLNDK